MGLMELCSLLSIDRPVVEAKTVFGTLVLRTFLLCV